MPAAGHLKSQISDCKTRRRALLALTRWFVHHAGQLTRRPIAEVPADKRRRARAQPPPEPLELKAAA